METHQDPSSRPPRRNLVKLVLVAGAVLAALAAAVVAGRILLYKQRDDAVHLASKEAYLERIAGLSGKPTGPNVVLIVFDDLGYGDLGAYGSRAIRTPSIDRLAQEGLRFTHAYSASPYCSAARAALLTGRYAVRSGLDHVLQPREEIYDALLRLGGRHRRLPAEEITLGEVLAAAGYETAMVGKWHLGDESPSLPTDRGFASFFGLLFSNDQGEPRLYEDQEVVEEHPIDQTTLTRRYTERAVGFIEESHGRSFFLYMPHTFPHIPLHASAERRGTSDAGLYGDVVEELDWSLGEVMTALERTGVAEETLVLVTSDNGPWFQGSSGGTRGRKLDIFEGGMRVPLLVRWPGRVMADAENDEVVMGIDVFPTVLDLAALPLPEDRRIDGLSLAGLLTSGSAPEREAILYYQLGVLKAVRSGSFKYHVRHGVFFGNPMDWPWGPMKQRGPWLFDLAADPDESYDVTAKHPEVAERLRGLVAAKEREMAVNPQGWLR